MLKYMFILARFELWRPVPAENNADDDPNDLFSSTQNNGQKSSLYMVSVERIKIIVLSVIYTHYKER